ncbi:FTR1 family protein [Escherichia coli]
MLGLATAVVLLAYWAVFASILVHFLNGPACLFSSSPQGWQLVPLAHSRAGLWNHFQEIAFDMSAVLSTHSLFGTLMEGFFGYQEAPSVSEVAVWFIYLIPALVAFALPPRAGATASRSA